MIDHGFIRIESMEYNMNIPSELIYLFDIYYAFETIYLCHQGKVWGSTDSMFMTRFELNDVLVAKDTDLTLEFF